MSSDDDANEDFLVKAYLRQHGMLPAPGPGDSREVADPERGVRSGDADEDAEFDAYMNRNFPRQ
jgi:hypothetical protein